MENLGRKTQKQHADFKSASHVDWTVHKGLGLWDLADPTQTQQRDTTLSWPLPTFICNVYLLLVLKLMRLLKATEKPYSNLSSILRDIYQTH